MDAVRGRGCARGAQGHTQLLPQLFALIHNPIDLFIDPAIQSCAPSNIPGADDLGIIDHALQIHLGHAHLRGEADHIRQFGDVLPQTRHPHEARGDRPSSSA